MLTFDNIDAITAAVTATPGLNLTDKHAVADQVYARIIALGFSSEFANDEAADIALDIVEAN